MSRMVCPKCHGVDIRKMSLIYEQGVSSFNSTTTGGAVGFGAAAIGAGYTNGLQISALSARTAPPSKAEWWRGLPYMLGLWFLTNFSPWWWLGVAFGALAIAGAIFQNRVEWPKAYASWNAQFMCLQCGFVSPAEYMTERARFAETPLERAVRETGITR